jgi:type I restriction enzyme S subunit
MPDLKPGWQRVKFGEVVRLNKETCKDPEAAGINRVIGLEHLEPGDLRVRSWADVADGTTFSNRVRPGQVLFGKRRAYQRKVAVAEFDAICSGDIYVFETANQAQLLQELLPYICQTDSFFEYAVGTSAGSLSPRTSWKSLAEYEFALPPLEEQMRLMSLLIAVRNAEETLCDAKAKMRIAACFMRDKATFHGESESAKIPVSWEMSRVGDEVNFIGGSQPPASTFEFQESPDNIRLIQIRDYKSDNFLTFIPRHLAKKNCAADDVMIGRYGPPVFQILRGLEGSYNVALIKAMPKERVAKEYLYHYLKGQALLRMIEGLSRRSGGQSGVDMEKLKDYPMAVPPLQDQIRISHALDLAENAYQKAVEGRRLKLAVLKKMLDELWTEE